MRKLIAAMKISIDAKMTGPDGVADWVDAWSDDYGLMPQIDACVIGGEMYPGYEQYWPTIRATPDQPHPHTGTTPTPAEVEWARFATQTQHYVLSNSLASATWPANTRFLRGLDDLAALKQQPGKDIYLMGGARVTASAIDAGLVDELRLIVYPLIAGAGQALFATTKSRRALELRKVEQLPEGLLNLIYDVR